MRVTSFMVCILLCVMSVAHAAPDTSLRPMARGATDDLPSATTLKATRPVARPDLLETAIASRIENRLQATEPEMLAGLQIESMLQPERAFAAPLEQAFTMSAVGLSLRPSIRPDGVVRKAMAKRQERARGAVCGDPAIQGEVVGFVPGQINGCGIEEAVRVRSVSGIPLSQQAMVDCGTAKALKRWMAEGMKPAVGDFRGGVKQVRVAAHYACRSRNHQAGARISEHGKGRAIDISGFVMRDGSEITILKDWDRADTGPILRRMHKSACGIFGTVLGPQSDRFHQDHFHFDTARYRSGAYCR